MSFNGTSSSEVQVEVDGAPLNPLVSSKMISAEIDLSLFTPSTFRLAFRGNREDVLLLGGFQLASKVNLQVTQGGAPVPLMTLAEVTAVDVEYGPDGNLTVVRGMDASHRLMRGTKLMIYPDMTASDLVTLLCGEAGLEPGEIIPTETVYEFVSQANISSWVMIQQLAAMENCVAYVDTLGLFNFGPMTMPEEGLPPVMSLDIPPVSTQLVMEQNLIRLHGSVGASEAVPAVTVTGWDPKMNMPVVGLAPTVPSTAQSEDPLTQPPLIGAEFEAMPFFDASRPVDSQGAAENRARSIAADIAGAMAEIEGQCVGNPAIVAGESISLGMVGPPFDGQYICTGARHVFEPDHGGYSTWFTVGGRRDRSMYALTGAAHPVTEASRPNIDGVVTGTVVNNMDPDSTGRVQVMFPWLGASYMSAWARTCQMGAGPLGGCLWLPEVGDEVLVGFDRGNIDYPYVIGGLYNGVFKPEPGPQVEGLVASRRLTSRMLHTIEFDDGPDKLGITVKTGTETCSIVLDAEQEQVTVTALTTTMVLSESGVSVETTGDFKVTAAGQCSIEAAGGVTIQTGGSFSLESTGVSIEAPDVSIESASISLGA